MGRRPCCVKVGLEKGAWTAQEDQILSTYIKIHGEGKWRDLPQRAGLKRCGKSCRLRWLNYLRPDIKRGNISVEEEDLIIRLHRLLGNRWSLIARRLPGRTDNEIKNYWNTNLSKRVLQGQKSTHNSNSRLREKETVGNSGVAVQPQRAIRTKAVRGTKVTIPQQQENDHPMLNKNEFPTWEPDSQSSSSFADSGCFDFLMDYDISDLLISDVLNSESYQQKESANEDDNGGHGGMSKPSQHCDFPMQHAYEAMMAHSTQQAMLENLRATQCLQPHEALELDTLASFINSGDE